MKQNAELLKGIDIIFEQRGGNKNLIDEEQVTRDFALATATAIKNKFWRGLGHFKYCS